MNKINIIVLIAGITVISGLVYMVDEGLFGIGKKQGIYSSKITMYKSSNCECCGRYADELKKIGVDMNIVAVEDMTEVKNKRNIPISMRSCHTMEVDDYIIEGHVPIEAIEKLLLEKPKIDGIALPGMPAGSLGMPGYKNGSFSVYQIKDGKYEEYISI